MQPNTQPGNNQYPAQPAPTNAPSMPQAGYSQQPAPQQQNMAMTSAGTAMPVHHNKEQDLRKQYRVNPKHAQQPAPTQKMASTSQNSLLLSEIRDSMAIMNDGSMRAVVTCQSINYDLMSEREREAVEYSYQNFLNSLYFPVQILVRSQRVDIGPYLDRLQKIRRGQDNMLLGVLMDDYIDFVEALAQETNIMEKNFFIVIPYFPAGDMNSAINSSKNLLANLFAPQTQQFIRINEQTYSKAKDELRNRSQTVMNGLQQIGVRAVRLNTKQLGELYYNTYNPDTAVRQPIADFNSLSAPVITKGQGANPHARNEGI